MVVACGCLHWTTRPEITNARIKTSSLATFRRLHHASLIVWELGMLSGVYLNYHLCACKQKWKSVRLPSLSTSSLSIVHSTYSSPSYVFELRHCFWIWYRFLFITEKNRVPFHLFSQFCFSSFSPFITFIYKKTWYACYDGKYQTLQH